mmetsp:Transcript_27920/g.80680  ORF Transcript_27920/g.80680 Transcript_27920/m.80680 type:complete len:119 (-) Transcript_27920:64-420(-)
MTRMGYFASKADPDIWMKDCGDHYSYVAVYVDDCLCAGKDGKAFFDELKSLDFKLKGCDESSRAGSHLPLVPDVGYQIIHVVEGEPAQHAHVHVEHRLYMSTGCTCMMQNFSAPLLHV